MIFRNNKVNGHPGLLPLNSWGFAAHPP